MAQLGTREKRCRSIGTGRNAGTAANTRRRIHGMISGVLRNGYRVPIRRTPGWRTHVPSRSDQAVECASIDYQVPNDRKRRRTKRLEVQHVAIGKVTHVQLTDRSAFMAPVGNAIDHESAGTANALATVMVKGNWRITPKCQIFVDHIEHFKKRHVGIDVVRVVGNHAAGRVRALLAPYV